MIERFEKVPTGAVISFPFSAYAFMKVCSRQGVHAVVNLFTGELLNKEQLMQDKLGLYCKVMANNVEEYILDE